MKIFNLWIYVLVVLSISTGCTNDVLLDDFVDENDKTPFVLRASYTSVSNSRLTFGESGINLMWEDGDKLLLYDVNDEIDPILLTTHLNKPSTTAEFRSEHAVPAGKYFVRSFGDFYYNSPEECMSFGLEEADWTKHTSGYKLSDRWSCDFLYAPIIEITEGQASASIELKHAYSMLKFNIIGTELLTSGHGEVSIGMLCPTKAFPIYAQLDENGEYFNKVLTATSRLEVGEFLGGREGVENIRNKGTLILPVDMTGQNVYFYLREYHAGFASLGWEPFEHVYEFTKEGKNLKPGVAYTVNLDLRQARKITIENGELSKPEHFRALAYHPSRNKYSVVQDIDFEGETYFPMSSADIKINGNGHTLSNMEINWPFEGAGLFESIKYIEISNLNLKDITVNGSSRVGAFGGATGTGASLLNCNLLGNCHIVGTGDYIGGLVGGPLDLSTLSLGVSLSNCSVSSSTIVSGQNFVGGMAGRISRVLSSNSNAKVIGVNNVGGIAGYADGLINGCKSSAHVTASGDWAGGIIGGTKSYAVMYYSAGKVNQSSFTGSISGNNYVGGILGEGGGDNTITESFSTGIIRGASMVGGISGYGGVVTNCYSLSEVTGTDATTTAGIVGTGINRNIEKCYFAGILKGGSQYGISGGGELYEGRYSNIKNCLTTMAKLSVNDPKEDGQYVNLSSIKSYLDYINVDKVYSESTVWEDFSNECPLFLWQIPYTETKGIVAPGFETDEW